MALWSCDHRLLQGLGIGYPWLVKCISFKLCSHDDCTMRYPWNDIRLASYILRLLTATSFHSALGTISQPHYERVSYHLPNIPLKAVSKGDCFTNHSEK